MDDPIPALALMRIRRLVADAHRQKRLIHPDEIERAIDGKC